MAQSKQPKQVGKIDGSGSTYGYRHKETLPLELSAAEIIQVAQASSQTKITAEKLLDRILLEGRGDAGVNEYNSANKQAVAVYNKAKEQGHERLGAMFLAAVLDKAQVAQRKNISFDEAWNGTGTSSYGKTGKDYVQRSSQMEGAARDPRNADLLGLINRAREDKLTSAEKIATLRATDLIGRVYGDEYLSSFKPEKKDGPFAAALVEKYKKHELPIESISPDEASEFLRAYVNKEVGNQLSRWQQDVVEDKQRDPRFHEVFTEMAKEALPALGIKPKKD